MGSVAAAMQDKGFQVTGQDENVYPPMSTFLESKGVKITPGFNPADIPAADLIVIGNAILRPFRAMTYLASLVEPPKRADSPKEPPAASINPLPEETCPMGTSAGASAGFRLGSAPRAAFSGG